MTDRICSTCLHVNLRFTDQPCHDCMSMGDDHSKWEPIAVPHYEHDCDVCTFLGHYYLDDLYYCPQAGHPTVIARHSSEPSDCASGMVFASTNPALGKARKLAQQRGMIP